MSRPHTPDTARPIYATGFPSSFYDQARTPKVVDYGRQLLPVPWLTQTERPRNELPPHTPATARQWQSLPNRSGRALREHYGRPDEVRVALDEFGEVTVYDAGVPRRPLNARAPEFRPAGSFRPSSALSSRSSASTASSSVYATSSATAISSNTSATSVSSFQAPSSGGKSPAPALRRSPLPPISPIPVFPHVDPGERAYRAYRERLRREPDLTAPIQCILETGVGSYELTQHIAILANRLSAHALCGPAEFRARLRAEALGMFQSYWRGDNGPWCSERSVPSQYLMSRGINIAAFMGSLFRFELISGSDMHACLETLLSTGAGFFKLQAVHAAFVHCGERICVGDTGRATALVRSHLTARGPNGQFLWGPHDESHVLLQDLLESLDRWSASEEVSQIRSSADALYLPSATVRSRRTSPAAPRQTRLPTPIHGYGHC
ncbi:hypothetical protein FB451DRAFT_1491253 [Mycena latifolia]|nr:hypothetical protein FB451DRAFT_1491253 [Mycena latifolia]